MLKKLLAVCVVMCLAFNAGAALVVQYNFDEGSGTVAHDSSGNGYDLSPIGSGTGSEYAWVPGFSGSAIGTPGANDSYLTATLSPTAINPYQVTVDVMIKPIFTDIDPEPKIVSVLDGFALELNKPNNSMRWIGMTGGNWYWTSVSDVRPLFDGNWHHIVASYDGRALNGQVTLLITVDGVLQAANDFASATPVPFGKADGTMGSLLTVGNNAWFVAGGAGLDIQSYDGGIDNLMIYSGTIPEPATMSLLAAGALALIRRKNA